MKSATCIVEFTPVGETYHSVNTRRPSVLLSPVSIVVLSGCSLFSRNGTGAQTVGAMNTEYSNKDHVVGHCEYRDLVHR